MRIRVRTKTIVRARVHSERFYALLSWDDDYKWGRLYRKEGCDVPHKVLFRRFGVHPG